MYKFAVGGKVYNVSPSKVEIFLKKYPNAVLKKQPSQTQKFIVDGKSYMIDRKNWKGFSAKFGDKIQTPEMYVEQQTALAKQRAELKETEELSNWQQFKNIFYNASLTLQNSWNSTQLASVGFANYLGIVDDNYADDFIEKEYGEIEAINKKYADTGKGIVGGFEEGDLADVALGIVNALTSVVTTVAPAIATRGLSLVPQIMAPMYTEYNSEKAKMLYGDEDIEESIRKLRENEEDEVAVPMALGAAAVALERIGIKGISKHVLNNARTAGAKKMGDLVLTGSREGLTEYFQGGLNVANKSFAQGNDINIVRKKIFSHLGSKDALEEFLQGFVGGTGISAAGAKINSAFRDDKDNLIVNGYINELGSLNQQKVNSKTKEAKAAIDKKIKKAKQDFKNFLVLNQKKSEYLTEDQSKEIVNILDSKNNFESKLKELNKQKTNGDINQAEYDVIVNDIKEQVELGDKNLNDIKVEANKKKLHEDLQTSEDAMSGIKGLTQKVYKTPDEFLKAINSKQKKQYTLEDLQNVDGLIVDGEVMINETVAAENNAVTVGSHELLHGIVKSSLNGEVRTIKDSSGNNVDVDLTVEGAKLIKEFLGTLNAKETKVVQKRIDDNYKYNKDGSEKAFEQYAEEYLNAYADAAIKNELSDIFLVKIGKFLSKIFNAGDKGYKNLEFKTGKDVKEFLKAYVSDRKKGKFRQQFVKMAQEGAATKTVINKESRSKAVDAVNEMEQGVETKAEFQKPGIFNNIYNSITQNGGAINNYVKSLGLSKEKFQETIDSLSDRLMNYDPAAKRKTDTGGKITIGEFLMSNVAFAKLDAAKKLAIEGKRKSQEKSTDIGATTKEGEVKMQVEDTDTSAQQALDEQDMSVEGIAKQEAKETKAKKKRYSKLRQELGFETDGDTYNTVLDAARKSILLAYKKTLKITDTKARVDKIVDLIKKEYNSLNSDLFKPLKDFLGTKEYLNNLRKFREAIVESISTADLVQMEKFTPDSERIFTTFVKKLTKKSDVQDAVNKNLLPKDALNTIDKGEAVNLYQKVMPNQNEFIGFADQPAINPTTGQRSGLKGTRKDGFAKRIGESLILDAVMEVRQEADVQQTLTEDLGVQMDIQQLASKIGREVDVKFSKSNAVTDMNNAIDLGTNTSVYSEIRFSKSHREQYENRLKKNRTDLTEEQRENAVQSVFDFVDSKDIPNNKKSKYEKMAMHYMVNGHLILPEDGYKVVEVDRLAAKNKIDPFSVKDPNALIQTYVEDSKTKRTDPDKVKTFSNKTEYSSGVVVYDVEDSKQGQKDVRKVADTHFGPKFQSWCLIHRQDSSAKEVELDTYDTLNEARSAIDLMESDPNSPYTRFDITFNNTGAAGIGLPKTYTVTAKIDVKSNLDQAWINWKDYNTQGNGHKIAFHNGKLVSFRDGNGMSWWDINDNPTDAVVVRGKKVGDGFKEVIQVSEKKETLLYTEKQTGNNKNGTYIKKNLNGDIVEITNKKDGKKNGKQFERKETVYYTAEITSNWKDNSRDSYEETRSYKEFKGKSKQEVLSIGRDQLHLDNITKWKATKNKEGVTTTTVEGTVKQDMFEEAKNPDAIKDPFTNKNFKYLVLSNERYFPLQSKKVSVKHVDDVSTLSLEKTDIDNIKIDRADNVREAGLIISKAKAEGKAAYMLEDALGDIIGVATEPKLSGGEVLVINSEVQETRVKFSRSANNEVKFSFTNRQEQILLPSYINKTIKTLKEKEDINDGDRGLLDVLEAVNNLGDIGAVNISNILFDQFDYIFNNLQSSDFNSQQSFMAAVKRNSQAQMKVKAYDTSKKVLEKQIKSLETEQAVEQIVNYLINIGRDVRSSLIVKRNKQLQVDVINNLQDGKFKKYFKLKETIKGSGKYKMQYKNQEGKFVDVDIYESVENIKNNIRKDKELVNKVNEQAKKVQEWRLKTFDPENKELTLGDKLDLIELTNTGTRGSGRKAATVDATVTEESKLKSSELELEHEITIKNMKSFERSYAKGNITKQQMQDVYIQNKVHVLPKRINDILRKTGKVSQRQGMGYESIPEVATYLNKLKDKGIINKLPESLQNGFVRNSNNILKTINFSKSSKNPTKGISILDFDDTLATSSSLIKFTRPDDTKGTLTPEQYASTYEDLLGLDYKFDFSEFNKVVDGKPAPLLNKAKKLASKFGTDNMFILTARPQESALAIQKFLKENGLDIPLKNITGLGNSTADAKALWVLDKAAEGYNDFYFADDAIQNVKAVKVILDQVDVKSKVQQAKVKFSKSIDGEFNGILERISGIGSEKRFSDAQAKLRGNKGRYKGLVPASAQDFLGLLYNFIGKGKKGDADIAFFKKALIDPFARAIDDINRSRQAAANSYKDLTKRFPKIKKQLNKKVGDTGFTYDQAVRVYLWNKAGFKIPGLSQRDLNALDSIVKNDPNLQAFADNVGNISKKKDGYSKPGEHWLVENITSDLISDGAIGDARSEFLTEWQENVDQIFSPENLNKIEAIYGSKFREALQDMLYRMKTGKNRPTGSSRIMNTYMNWVNNSVGAIMFFNIRSAVLQTISATNYINWSFNNPLKAAQAFANQKQYWSDFTTLFNSDYLKQRRSGNRRGVNEADLTNAIANSENKAKAALAWLLSKGFLPTQIADSFAIASGGASFYRNSIKKYIKEGMTKAQAEQQAFIDFQETTEVAQQSARPDMISQQQANPLGRLILSFQNTPMQYGRIMNKAFRDLTNGRGDAKTHMSKIIYYGGIQAVIFGALQSAIFAALSDEDEEEFDKKKKRIVNQMMDSWLSTFGYGGKAISTVKGTVEEYLKQKDKGWNADHAYTLLRVLSFSPPIGSKLRKIYSAIQTDKFNEDVYGKRGFTLDNPIWNAFGSVIEGFTNVPLGRIANKMLNLDNAMDSNNQWWERVALIMGWNTWDLGIKDKDIEEAKKEIKKEKKTKTKKTKDKKQEIENKEKENKKKKDGNCIAISTSGNRCKNKAESGGYCTIHAKVDQGTKEVQCKKVKSDKKRCKMKTKAKSGLCYYHD